jgi:uncharacterized protein YlzI (FlbEa/FlbD family)
MLALHRLNGTDIIICAELVEFIEPHGTDTVIHMVTGNRFVVKESVEQVVACNAAYRQQVSAGEQKGGRYVLDDTSLSRDSVGVRLSTGRILLGGEGQAA